MKSRILAHSLVAVGILTLAAAATAQNSRSESSVLDEDLLMRFFEEPESQFHRARELFFHRKYKASAQAIRTAAGYMRLECIVASPKGEALVRASADNLDRLAEGVENRTVHSAQKLDQAFAGAHYAMGKNHNLKAVEYMAQGRLKPAGSQLQAAVHHAAHGYQWAGLSEKDDALAAFKKANETARLLAEKAKEVTGEMKDVVKNLNDRLDDIAQRLMPTPPSP